MRPRLHVEAPRNWVNDPNGPILWHGRYHLYYQHNPAAPQWAKAIHWGHAVSDDLISWADEGIALSPTPGAADADGCWSGCTRVVDGLPTIYYTGLAMRGDSWDQSVCTATATDDTLRTFTKDPGGPVVSAAPRPAGHDQHRDPFLLRDEAGDRWIMLQATGIHTDEYAGGAVVLYDSPDGRNWSYRGVTCTLPDATGDLDTGPVWECPAMFEAADGTWVMIISVQLPPDRPCRPFTMWFTGNFDGLTFDIARAGRLDHSDVLYAPTLLSHPDGRQLLWGWVQERATQEELDERGSAGALSLPREVEVVDGRVVTKFADELDSAWADVPIDGPTVLSDPGPCWRLRASVTPGAAFRIGTSGGGPLVLQMGADAVHLLHGAHTLASMPAATAIDLIVDDTIVELHTSDGFALTARLPYGYDRDLAVTAGNFENLRLQTLAVSA